MNEFKQWYKEQYLLMRILVWLAALVIVLAMVLWVTHTPSSRKIQKHITIKCDPNRYQVCRQ